MQSYLGKSIDIKYTPSYIYDKYSYIEDKYCHILDKSIHICYKSSLI